MKSATAYRPPRWVVLDAGRGLALLAMLIYHFVFDYSFLIRPIVDLQDPFWSLFPRAIAFTFLFIAGVSLYFSELKRSALSQSVKNTHLTRAATLLGLALGITAVTGALFPKYTIWFGILHAISFCVLLFWPLSQTRHRSKIPFVIAVIALLWLGLQWPVSGIPLLLWLGAAPQGFTSFDYVPLLPWALPFILGLYFAPRLQNAFTKSSFSPPKSGVAGVLVWMGRNSLVLYLIHQPIFAGLLLLVQYALGSG